MRLLTTWTKFHSQIQQCQHSVTKRESVKTANGETMFPDAKQPAAREAAQLTIGAIVKLQRSGLRVPQAPRNPTPQSRLHRDRWLCSITRGGNCEQRATTKPSTEMPNTTPGLSTR